MLVQVVFVCLAVFMQTSYAVSGNCSTKVSACLNGGTCVDVQNRFTCVCKAGFTGRTCSSALRVKPTKTCPRLHIRHGKVAIYNRKIGKIAVFKCNKGFTFSGGAKIRICMNGARDWTYGRQHVICRPRKIIPQCTFSRSLRHGKVRVRIVSRAVTEVMYVCNKGYTLIQGLVVRKCISGKWDSTKQPKCRKAKKCKKPKSPVNGQMFGGTFMSGSRVHFICNDGYDLIGAKQITCQLNGLWEKHVPKCLKKDPLRDLKIAADKLRLHFINKLELLTTDSRARSGLSSGAAGLDLVFVFDSSASVGAENFKKGIEFARTIISEFGVSNSSMGTRVAVAVFSNTAQVIYNLKSNRIVDQDSAIQTLKNLKLQGGGTATALALQTVIDKIIPEVRNNSKKALFLITDGKSNAGGDPSRPAKVLRDGYYFEVFAIGVTSQVNEKELRDIASEPFRTHVYLLDDFQSLETLRGLITKKGSNFSECGAAGDTQFRDVNAKDAKVGTVEAKSGAWPWIAAVYVRGSFRCVGVLIAEDLVLTVAHCFTRDVKVKAREIVVQLGEHDRTFMEGSEQNIRVQKIIKHKRMSKTKVALSLLKLREKAKLTAYVRTVCLPVPTDRVVMRTNAYGVVAGWGSALKMGPANKDGPASPVLKQTRLRFISKFMCQKNASYTITDTMMCAADRHGRKDDSTCDIGSPMMVYRPDRANWAVAGLSILTDGCAYQGKSGVYSNLLHNEFQQWINKKGKIKSMG